MVGSGNMQGTEVLSNKKQGVINWGQCAITSVYTCHIHAHIFMHLVRPESSQPEMPITEAQLPRCTPTDALWMR